MNNSKIKILLETISENSDNPFAHFALAREYQKMNDHKSAGQYYQHLIRDFPDYGGTYYHYAVFLFDDGDMEGALNVIDKGLSILHKNKENHLFNELRALRDQYKES